MISFNSIRRTAIFNWRQHCVKSQLKLPTALTQLNTSSNLPTPSMSRNTNPHTRITSNFVTTSTAVTSISITKNNTNMSVSHTPNDKHNIVHLDSKSGNVPSDMLWSRNTSEMFPQRDISNFNASWDIAMEGIPLLYRFFTSYYLKEKFWKKNATTFEPFFHNTIDPNQKGAPVGGLGAGTITRSFQGDFTRWNIAKPGIHHNNLIAANQFHLRTKRPSQNEPVAVVLNSNKDHLQWRARYGPLGSWQWWGGESNNSQLPSELQDMTATYHSLYPRSWYQYSQPSNGLSFTCRQFSPVIGHNYRESSFPVANYEYEFTNHGSDEIEVSVMFTFQNGGTLAKSREPRFHEDPHRVNTVHSADGIVGVEMKSTINVDKYLDGVKKQVRDPLTMMIAAKKDEGVEVTVCPMFETTDKRQCANLWDQFKNDGSLHQIRDDEDRVNHGKSFANQGGRMIGSAVCVKVVIPAGETRRASFTLVWDHPRMQLGQSSYFRRYTKFFANDGTAALQMAVEALQKSDEWDRMIQEWQEPVLTEESLPAWLRGHMFNEMYYMADGGTIWSAAKYNPFDGSVIDDGCGEYGFFGYLEGHEYIMLTTYDVHFYASNAFLVHFPQIQLAIQRHFAQSINWEDDTPVTWCGSGQRSTRKVRGTMPHDMGTIDEDPWVKSNSYIIQDVNRWKDLNCMFVLSVLRDYRHTKDEDFLREMYPCIEAVLKYHEQFDKDGDGVIENEGWPDSTYDFWTVTGIAAFSGGLYIHANKAAAEIARIVGKHDRSEFFMSRAKQGKESYVKALWNGRYFNYDSSDSGYHDSIMADQLHGHFISKLSGVDPLLDDDKVMTTLDTIYEYNVRKYADIVNGGKSFGCVNGMRPDGKMDHTSLYSREVWTGVSYATAAVMLQHGKHNEAFEIAQGVKQACWHDLGFWFQVPETFYPDKTFRANCYMRPLAIWAIWLAVEKNRESNKTPSQDTVLP